MDIFVIFFAMVLELLQAVLEVIVVYTFVVVAVCMAAAGALYLVYSRFK